jgi:hypothetical protein
VARGVDLLDDRSAERWALVAQQRDAFMECLLLFHRQVVPPDLEFIGVLDHPHNRSIRAD